MNQASTTGRDAVAPAILPTLVTYTAWANRQLFGALRDVDAFASHKGADLILLALDHIHVVRRIFQAHLQGVPHDFKATRSAVLPTLEELDRAFDDIDRWYVDIASSLSDEELERARPVRFTDDKVVTMTPAAMLLHVTTHTIHHRGNVDVIMLQTGMARRRDGVPEFLISRASAT